MNFVEPVISEQKAEEIFSKKRNFFHRSPSEITKLELIYLPNYTFKLTVRTKKSEQEVYVSVDGIKGTFAFLDLENVNLTKEGSTPFDFELSQDIAEKIAKDEYRGIILQSGLQAKIPAEIKNIKRFMAMYYPYWICYYKKGDLYNFSVLDAVNGKLQGIKMKPVFLQAFSQK
ncbi:hypothetical protein KAW48_10055 [candidate division WOR-3 bacterium]|nr:hypothetical protein [candidate division WOR-3 bacterium]